MKTAGIICEYNPFHLGHAGHIEKTRRLLGGDCAVVCVMSGNFVQRGDVAVFRKHARAKMAVLSGADLVVELPAPYALSSAEGFAHAGVFILDSLGVCDAVSFGSESGDIGALREAAAAIVTPEADALVKEWLGNGMPYASVLQKAADAVLGPQSELFKTPNNLLGIEYIKAIAALSSPLAPITVERTGGDHDGETGYSASALRKTLLRGGEPWELMPEAAAAVCMEDISAGLGPVFASQLELAIMARLRATPDFSALPGAAEGLDRRFARCAASEPSVADMLAKIKTKRYAMSRIRRMLMCACLGITAVDTKAPPPYIRVLAMNNTGMELLRAARKKSRLPVITKPASVIKLGGRAKELFDLEAAATDFYALAYPDARNRSGGREWRDTPPVLPPSLLAF